MKPQDITPGTPQQQVIERLRTAVNVLVTVSNNPSVDQLAAAIGTTLMLNKLGKHATAVFSGQVPSTIQFLKPEATLEKNTDSLRDFIVSLDKSKADKLRYKVEENVVKIFITPYRTSLSEQDLNFSQGDFNVDVVLALGVSEREQLDQAIISHGRILHDATVITVSAGQGNASLGAINWLDTNASSLCEMLVGVGDTLQAGLLDNQIATAFLTGLVAQTERFRNDKTTPKIMTLAAQLMAAGANQQLIAAQLDHAVEATLKPAEAAPVAIPAPDATPDGSLSIDHTALPAADIEVKEEAQAEESKPEENTAQIAIDEHGNLLPPDHPEPVQLEVKPHTTIKKETRHQLIEPQPQPALQEKNENIFAGGTNSSMVGVSSDDGENEPAVDPLSVPENTPSESTPSPLLPSSENAAPQSTEPEPAVEDSALQPVLPPAADDTVDTIPPAMDDHTLRDIEKTLVSKHITEDPTSTLNEIEEVMESPHLENAAGDSSQALDGARNAVSDAISATPYDPTRPEPLQALNATAVNLPIGGQSAAPASDPVLAGLGLSDSVPSQAPPPVPPPMMAA
jgi:hypothetical protein